MNFLSGTTNNSTATSSPVGAQSRNMFDDYKPVFEDFRDYDNDDEYKQEFKKEKKIKEEKER